MGEALLLTLTERDLVRTLRRRVKVWERVYPNEPSR
jgi:ribosomal protein L16/L10AE